MSDDLLKSLL